MLYPEHFTATKGGTGYGVAFDIGTTTVVGMLWDLEHGVQISTCGKANPQNEFCMTIGILPEISIDKVKALGNTAGTGASMILVGKYEKELSEKLPAKIRHIELSTKPKFQEIYMKGMMF